VLPPPIIFLNLSLISFGSGIGSAIISASKTGHPKYKIAPIITRYPKVRIEKIPTGEQVYTIGFKSRPP
jgi:hypothetical protein